MNDRDLGKVLDDAEFIFVLIYAGVAVTLMAATFWLLPRVWAAALPIIKGWAT